MNTLKPRIYIACLAAYNAGYLHGAWIDAGQEINLMQHEVNKILSNSPIPHAEEWAIHDYEGFGHSCINEYAGLDTVSELATFIAEHGELGSAMLDHTGGDLDDARCNLEDCYHGEFNSEEDFTRYLTNEVNCSEIPDYLSYYIDYQAMARDFFINDFFSIELHHKVYVFSHR